MTVEPLKRESQNDGSEWAERSGYWLKALEAGKPKRKRREKETQPLILNGHGLSISVDKGILIIGGGYTHYPAEKREWRFFKGELTIPPRIVREWRFFKGELTIPPRIVIVDGAGNITLDALASVGLASFKDLKSGSRFLIFAVLTHKATIFLYTKSLV